MSSTPRIRALTVKLLPYICRFLKARGPVIETDVHSYLEQKKTEQPDEFSGIAFRRAGLTAEGYPWSHQVYFVMTNLIAMGIVAEIGNKVELIDYGKTLS